MTLSAPLAVPFFTAAVVLGVAGVSKIRRPQPAARALRAARLPSGALTVRAMGLAEAAIAALCLLAPSRPAAAALAAAYLAFAAFLASLILARVPMASCGCSGERDTPPRWIHVGLDLAGAGCAAAVALSREPPVWIGRVASGLPVAGLAFVVGIAALAGASILCAAYLPEALFAYRGRRP